MLSKDLNTELYALFEEVDTREEAHRHALAYKGAHERTTYMHSLVRQLSIELTAIRMLDKVITALEGTHLAATLRASTLQVLNRHKPADLEQIGSALIANSLHLMEIATYMAAATAHASICRREMAEHLTAALTHPSHEAVLDDTALVPLINALKSPEPLSTDSFSQLTGLSTLFPTGQTPALGGSNYEEPVY
jgi:hypothetical protein